MVLKTLAKSACVALLLGLSQLVDAQTSQGEYDAFFEADATTKSQAGRFGHPYNPPVPPPVPYWPPPAKYPAPSFRPTPPPYPSPTRRPTPKPTPRPMPRPTYKPTPKPTHRPTPHPTKPPVSYVPPHIPYGPPPTNAPIPYAPPPPTPYPTAAPSQNPSASPSSMPSQSPSMVPSASPSEVPSSQPSASPSIVPSVVPTLSLSPSAPPSISAVPSAKPSVSARPSQQPTVSSRPSTTPSISLQPSSTPSVSSMPSLKPTITPMPSESFEPSANPSAMPTPTADQNRLVTITFRDLSMTLFGISGVLSDPGLRSWTQVTDEFIEEFFSIRSFGFAGRLMVSLTNVQTEFTSSSDNGRSLTNVQTEIVGGGGNSRNEITFDASFTIRSSSDSVQLGQLAYLWLEETFDRARFVDRLQTLGTGRLAEVQGVTRVWGRGLPPGSTALVPIEVIVPNLDMTLIGLDNIQEGGGALVDRFEFATEQYILEYVTQTNPEAFGVANFNVNIDFTGDDRMPNVMNVVRFQQVMTFRTNDESLVPRLINALVALPFCDETSRGNYLDLFLRLQIGFNRVRSSSPVGGVVFDCNENDLPPAPGFPFDPTPAPSTVPTMLVPTAFPTAAPTPTADRSRILTFTFTDLSVALAGNQLQRFRVGELNEWATITEGFIRDFFSARVLGIVGNLNVQVTPNIDRSIFQSNPNTLNFNTIVFSLAITMRSSSRDLQLGKFGYMWLSSDIQKNAYIERLRDSNINRLTNVESVFPVRGQGFPPTTNQNVPVRVQIPNLDITYNGNFLLDILNDCLTVRDRLESATFNWIRGIIQNDVSEYGVDDFREIPGTAPINIVRGEGNDRSLKIFFEFNFLILTPDASFIPALLDRIAAEPFCDEGAREQYVAFLRNDLFLQVVERASRVEGVEYEC